MAVPKPTLGKTGNAQIMKAGHTSSNRDGSDPNKREKPAGIREQGIR